MPPEHAASYGAGEWRHVDHAMLDDLAQRIDGFAGKRVLDLGGGPGQYTAALAQRGARVTWHDVSRTYLDMSRRQVEALGLAQSVAFSLGYLDEAPRLLAEPFDLVFNRICWNYGLGDTSFAAVVYALVKPGGFGYVDTTHSDFQRHELSASARLRTWLNDSSGIKIGHPYPPRSRLARLFLQHNVQQVQVDYRAPMNDRILFQKAAQPR